MATHDYVIANQTGANTRSDLNSAFSAIVSNNSSATAPATTYAFMWWADTANDLLKQRNAADSAWVDILTLSTGAPSVGGATEGTAVLSTGETGGTKFLREDGDGTSSWQSISSDPAMGGDLSGTASNAQIVANAVGTTEIANSAVTDAKIAGMSSSKLSGALPAIDGSALTNLSAGKVLQVVNFQTGAVATGTTQFPSDDTIPQNTDGNEYMSLAITPTSATSKLRIDIVYNMSHSESTTWFQGALFQDATTGALASNASYESIGTAGNTVSFSHTMTSGTTSATTFKLRLGGHKVGTTTFNGQTGGRLHGGVLSSSITITEYEV
jgi:hypothetical protein